MASRILTPAFPLQQTMAYKKSHYKSKKQYAKPKRSEYAKARKQMDGSRFVIMGNLQMEINVDSGQTVGPVKPVSALYNLMQSEMFKQVCDMYDEFRIKSMKVKIMPMQTTNLPSGQLVVNTAWDRNGMYKKTYFSTAG